MVGEPGRGVPTIIEMVNHTRLDCVIGTAAGMRAAVAQRDLARRAPQRVRQAPGRPAADGQRARRPRHRVRGGDRASRCASRAPTTRRADDPRADAFKRLATAVAKYHVCKRAPGHAFEALECLGGNGYVEASGMPRLYREAPLASIWEGSGNVMALDVLRALARSPEALDAFFAEIDEAAGADPRLDDFAAATRAEFSDLEAIEPRARRVVERMALCLQGSLLVRHAPAAGGRCLLRRAPGGRRGPALRHAAARRRRRGDRRAAHAAGVASADRPASGRGTRLQRRAWRRTLAPMAPPAPLRG